MPGIRKQVFGRSYDNKKPEDFEVYARVTDHNVRCDGVAEHAARVCAEFLLEGEKREERQKMIHG
ncbi:MAG: hypothetical protein GXX89_10540 [Clostridiales bacterium]|nr:hypothetical protein [Clostridiales bacterium]